MTNPIDNLMVQEGPAVFYDNDFKVVLESHLTYLRTHTDTVKMSIDPIEAYRFEGDLNGLLHSFNILPQYHWVIMRMNDYTSTQETTADLPSLLIPDISVIERLRQLFMITHKIS